MGKVEGITMPLVICDIGGQQIKQILLGAVVYRNSEADAGKAAVLHAHKKNCLSAAEEKLGKLDTSWQELGTHIEDILRTTGVSERTVVALTTALDSGGG